MDAIGLPAVNSDLGELIRTYDWTSSPVGPAAQWPAILKHALDLILPSHAQIVLFWGPEFIAFYNDAYAPTIGNKHPGALGRPACENWAELWDDLRPLLQHVRDTAETVSAQDRPFHIDRHGYTETVYFDISFSPLFDDARAVAGVVCIVSETTQRVLAQRALGESEERLNAVVTQAAGGIAQVNAEGRITFVNDAFCEIVSYQRDELLRMDIAQIIHPDDRQSSMAAFRQLLESGEPFAAEKRYLCKDGSYIWVSNSVSAIHNSQGIVVQAAIMVVDISKRKRAEESLRKLAAIIESSDDAIMSTDLDMTITSWNWGAERLYGYREEEVLGRSATLLLSEAGSEEERIIIDQIRRGERVEPHETRRRRKDGQLIDVLLTVSPVRDEQGNVVGASKIAHDIGARKEAERLQHVLTSELKHRVKNVIATVQAIARQTFKNHASAAAEYDIFEARLLSLARTHDLLTRESWEAAELRDIVSEALAPYQAERFLTSGPPVSLSARAALSLSLALHELATNAAKYGALSAETGKVLIEWNLAGEDGSDLELRWTERGGPRVSPPQRRGFGSRLVENILAAELGGQVSLAYNPEGVSCVVKAPLEVGWESAPAARAAAS